MVRVFLRSAKQPKGKLEKAKALSHPSTSNRRLLEGALEDQTCQKHR